MAKEGWSGANSNVLSNPRFKIKQQNDNAISIKKTSPETYLSFLTSNGNKASSNKNITNEDIVKFELISKTIQQKNSIPVNELEVAKFTLPGSLKGKDIFIFLFIR